MTADERDACTRWRHALCYVQRAGVRKAVKTRSHRLDRRRARQEARREL